MKATSRDSRSSFATKSAHFVFRAAFKAAAKFWPTFERVGAFARFDLDMLGEI